MCNFNHSIIIHIINKPKLVNDNNPGGLLLECRENPGKDRVGPQYL